jgi:hypothetical protein
MEKSGQLKPGQRSNWNYQRQQSGSDGQWVERTHHVLLSECKITTCQDWYFLNCEILLKVALNTKNQSNHLNREEKIVTFPPTGHHYHSAVFGSSNLNADHFTHNILKVGKLKLFWLFGWFMVFNATFNNISVISWWSVLMMPIAIRKCVFQSMRIERN